jgi:hypothetical protein
MVDERIESVGKRFRWMDDLNRLKDEVDHLKARVEKLEKPRRKSTGRKAPARK